MNEATLLEKRLILALVVLGGMGLMLWNHLITGDSMERIVIWVYGLFVTGKAADVVFPQYFAARMASSPAEKSRPT